MSSFGVIVHTGAGYHAQHRVTEYHAVTTAACRAAMAEMAAGRDAVFAVEAALVVLEDAQITNAGVGSCLTLEGTVECDASLTCARSNLFGAVGALSQVRNPSRVAAALLRKQMERPSLELGRISPSILVGEGARKWALDNGHRAVPAEELISRHAYKAYCKYKRRLDRCLKMKETSEDTPPPKKLRQENNGVDTSQGDDSSLESSRFDTVGAVCVDSSGRVVAGASSGGIAMKFPGRLGQVCVPGAGCWGGQNGADAVGVATTGTGEHLVRTMLAMRAGEACLMSDNDGPVSSVHECMQKHFLEAPCLDNVSAKNAGLIVLRTHGSSRGDQKMIEFVYAHTTQSLSVGYMTTRCRKPTVVMSRRSESSNGSDEGSPDQVVTIGAQLIKL